MSLKPAQYWIAVCSESGCGREYGEPYAGEPYVLDDLDQFTTTLVDEMHYEGWTVAADGTFRCDVDIPESDEDCATACWTVERGRAAMTAQATRMAACDGTGCDQVARWFSDDYGAAVPAYFPTNRSIDEIRTALIAMGWQADEHGLRCQACRTTDARELCGDSVKQTCPACLICRDCAPDGTCECRTPPPIRDVIVADPNQPALF